MSDQQANLSTRTACRAGRRLAVTVWLYLLTMLFGFSVVSAGGSFRSTSFVLSLPAIVWGFFALFTYRGKHERLVGWLAFILALHILWLVFESNLIFFFTRL